MRFVSYKSLYLCKALSSLLQVHPVSFSWLGSFIRLCLPSSLPVPVPLASVCPERRVSMVLSCYIVLPKHLCCHWLLPAVRHSQLFLLLYHLFWANWKENICQVHCYPQPKRKEHMLGPGELPCSQVHVCTLALSQTWTKARTGYMSTLPLSTLDFINGKPGKVRGWGGATWSHPGKRSRWLKD